MDYYVIICLGLAVLSNLSQAQYNNMVETPDTVYAPRGSTAEIPCTSSSRDLMFGLSSKDPIFEDRMSTFQEDGDTSLLVLSIKDLNPEDAKVFECTAGNYFSRVQLIVYEPTYPIVAVEVTSSNDVKVTWTPPEGPRDAIERYKLYVREVADEVGVVSFDVKQDPSRRQQQFLLEDLKPGATYDIQVSGVYKVGPDDEFFPLEGPKSAKVRIDTPNFNSPPVMVKAAPWKDSSILVTWKPPTNMDADAIDGYKVVYKSASKKNPQSGEMDVPPRDGINQYRAVLEGLMTKTRYQIAVYAVQNGVLGKKSQTVAFRHEGFASELSVKAMALDPETVLIDLGTVGGENVQKLRVLYSDDSATKWTRVSGCAVGRHCIVSGLQPRSKYFFIARARVNGRSRHVVTHVMTPPTDLPIPTELTVQAQTDHSIRASWVYPSGMAKPIGYVLKLELKENDEQEFRPFKQKVVFNKEVAEVDGLQSQDQYRAKVVPFNADGMGSPSETVLFSISPTGVDKTTEAPQFTAPRFIDVHPTFTQIDAGENATFTCIVIGNPPPMVLWTSNGSIVSQPQDRANVLYLYGVQNSMRLTCHAENSLGSISKDVRLDVSHGIVTFPTTTVKSEPLLQPQEPILAVELPKTVVRKRGEELHIRCRFDGNPPPLVTWYQMNSAIGQASQIESVLAIPSVQSSSTLRCEGKNKFGVRNYFIKLIVDEKPTQPQQLQDYKVSLRYISTTSSSALVKWVVDEGDILAIRYFDVTVTTQDQHMEVVRQRLNYDQRSIKIDGLNPGLRYNIKVDTITAMGVVNVASVKYNPLENMPVKDEPTVLLEVVEIRHNTARIDFYSLTPVRHYRLRVKDLEVRRLGNTILDRTLESLSTSINLERLKSNRQYQVILDAAITDRGRGSKVSASVIFVTPSPGQYGISVASRSDDQEKPTTTTANSTPREMMKVTTTEPVLTTTVDVVTMTTMLPTTTERMSETTTKASDDGYELEVSTSNETPYQADIRWTMNKGDLEAITNFLVTIKSSNGHTLLQQQLGGDQRSITIQSLTPNTRYHVDIEARLADQTILADDHIALLTLSADAVVDTSNPFLELEANEVRSSSVRLEWALVNGERRLVSGYTLKVLDKDATGVNLLTQNMAAASQSINLKSLPASRQFYVIVDALGLTGQVMATSSLTFSTAPPGGYGTPVKVSRPQDQSQPLRMMPSTQSPMQELQLDIEINPKLPYGLRINWTLHSQGGGRVISVNQYRLTVEAGKAGKIMLRRLLNPRTTFFDINGMRPNIVYYIHLDALDSNGQPMVKVSTSFKLPPTGHNVEPIRVSSNSTGGDENDDDSGDNQSVHNEMFITYILPVAPDNTTAVMVGWRVSPTVTASDFLMIRYAEFKGNIRGGFTIKYTGELQGKNTITGLLPNTRYGFQIARVAQNTQFTQWSDMVLYPNL